MKITLNGTECFLLGVTTNKRLLYMHSRITPEYKRINIQPRTLSCGSCQGTPRTLKISSSVSDAIKTPELYNYEEKC